MMPLVRNELPPPLGRLPQRQPGSRRDRTSSTPGRHTSTGGSGTAALLSPRKT